MIDSTREGEEEKEKEEAINDHHSSDSNRGNYNDGRGDIANSNEDIPGGEYGKFYEQYLYGLLPAIYQEYDTRKENNVLQEFLKIIASQAATIRQDIDGLLNNFFINSCDEWVIPYIADLIAAKVVPNSSLNSRLDVQNTIRWRKLKGTQTGLVDLIRNTINRNAKVKEAFKYCSSSQHLAFEASDIIVNKPYNFVNLRDQDEISNIDTESDTLPHTIDVREPSQASGWYNIKNLLLFMPQLNVYHIRQVQVEGEQDGLRYYFSNLVRKQQQSSSSSPPHPSFIPSSPSNHFPLYDLDEGVKIRGTTFARDPFKYFGKKRGMSVWIDNILAACPNVPSFSPAEQEVNMLENRVTIAGAGAESNRSNNPNDPLQGDYDNNNKDNTINNTDPDFVSLHKTEGIRILEQRNFSEPDKQFIIRLYCYSEENGPVEVGNYSTSKMSYYILPPSKLKKMASGTILISIELNSKMSAAEFPETVIAIKDSRRKQLVSDSILGKYRNALYFYLPSIIINYNEKKYFFVDRAGSTYEVQMINGRYDITSTQLGSPSRTKGNLRSRTAASSQIYPPRQLTYSMRPLHNFIELNRLNGIKAVDTKKYGKESFFIEAIAINYDNDQAWKIGRLQIKGGGSFLYVNEKEVWIRWRIILGGTPDIYREYFLPASHFKPKRLDLERNFEEYPARIEEVVKGVLPAEILSEYALDKKVGTFRIDPAPKVAGSDDNDKHNVDNADEFEVKITIRPEHSDKFEYLANEIKNAIKKKPEFINEGKLMLRISKTTRGDFPLSEIILTNNSGRSVLVYLPQLNFDKKDKKYDLYVTDDGSTSLEEGLLNPARKSAGQVIPIPNRYPLQQRIPVYMNLADWQLAGTSTVHFGELAIDPEHGRFAFSREDDYLAVFEEDSDSSDLATAAASLHNITADYNYAFSHDIGAGAYDRRASLKKKATKWVSKSGHASDTDAFPSKTFQTIADALASAEDGDVIQIEDSGIYNEDTHFNDITLPPGVTVLTLQAANRTMPVIKLTDRLMLNFSHSVTRINLNGILITGGPLTLHGSFEKLALISCTIDPGYDDKRFLGIRIEQEKKKKKQEEEEKEGEDDTALYTNSNNSYITDKSNTLLEEISLNKSISGGIVVDESVSVLTLEDSIVDNLGGPAILVNENNESENTNLKLEVSRSDILSKYQDPYVLKLRDICCSNSILTNIVKVNINQKKQDRSNNNSCSNTSLQYSRFEQEPIFEGIGKDNGAIVKCTVERPIFISTSFGHPAYLHLDHLTSKSILEGAENTLEMGVFNGNDKPLGMRNLNLKLREFLPIGIRGGVVYTY